MSLYLLSKAASSTLKALEDNESLALPLISSKLNKLAEVYPHDSTILGMAQVLNKMSDRTLVIKRAELKDLYVRFYSRNTKIAEHLTQELGEQPKLQTPKYAAHDDGKTLDSSKYVDQVMLNALESFFDKKVAIKNYSKKLASDSVSKLTDLLSRWGIHSNVKDVEGNSNFIIVKADFETPKGLTSVYVPVETANEVAWEPTVFIGNDGVEDLEKQALSSYIYNHAGKNVKIASNFILDTLSNSLNKTAKLSDAEIALAKLKTARAKETVAGDVIIGQKAYDMPIPDVKPTFSAEAKLFESKIQNVKFAAHISFGAEGVERGKKIIASELLNFGHTDPQVAVTSFDENKSTVFYGVSLGNRLAFTVPLKIANNRAGFPNTILCNGQIKEFSRNSINELSVSNNVDYKVASSVSSLSSLTQDKLLHTIETSLAEGNVAKAEDALNVIKQNYDENVYKLAFTTFVNGLNPVKTAESQCSMIVKNANSQHALCGHLNLPTHKVYQDEHGCCHQLYRKGMKESNASAFFMTSKILG